jgi:hypothetical protein
MPPKKKKDKKTKSSKAHRLVEGRTSWRWGQAR